MTTPSIAQHSPIQAPPVPAGAGRNNQDVVADAPSPATLQKFARIACVTLGVATTIGSLIASVAVSASPADIPTQTPAIVTSVLCFAGSFLCTAKCIYDYMNVRRDQGRQPLAQQDHHEHLDFVV